MLDSPRSRRVALAAVLATQAIALVACGGTMQFKDSSALVIHGEPPAPPPPPPKEEPPPPPKPKRVEVTADKIEIGERFNFAVDQALILPSSMPLVDRIADVLTEHPELTKVRIEGHTDDTGWHAYNVKLSQKRADAVRDALIKRGIDAARLEAVGLGASQPLVEGNTEAARKANRRVELVVVH